MNYDVVLAKFCEQHNVILGVCDASPLFSPKNTTNAPFMSYTEEQRRNPKLFLENAESIIVIGVGYGKNFAFAPDGKIRGQFAQSAIGMDYHFLVKEKLMLLYNILREQASEDFDYRLHIDNSPLHERALAVKAELGFIGKNGNIISQKFGSYFNIGCLVTSIPVEHFSITHINTCAAQCGGCTNCIDSCPGGALFSTETPDSGFCYENCVSYLTQKKGELTSEEMKKMGNWLYGCDICQQVCPYNVGRHTEEITDIDKASPELNSFLDMTKREFRQLYGDTAIYWRGLETIRRNAEIAFKNLPGLE